MFVSNLACLVLTGHLAKEACLYAQVGSFAAGTLPQSTASAVGGPAALAHAGQRKERQATSHRTGLHTRVGCGMTMYCVECGGTVAHTWSWASLV